MGSINDENYQGKKKAMSFKQALMAAQMAGFDFPFVIAAQFAIETGYGTANASAKNNFFNIKWNDTAAAKLQAEGINVTKGTKKVKDPVTGEEDFYMSFETPADAFHGLKTFLETNPRYERAGLWNAKTEEEYIQALQKAGYAQDKNYLSKLTGVINQARTEDITLMTPEEEAKLDSNYVNPESIKTELQKKKKKPSDVILEQQVKEANSKVDILNKAKADYDAALKEGDIEPLNKATKAYKEAYADARDLLEPLLQKSLEQEKERLLAKQKRFTPNSEKGIQIAESLKNIDLAIKANKNESLPKELDLSGKTTNFSYSPLPGSGATVKREMTADAIILDKVNIFKTKVNLNTANTLRPSNFVVTDDEVVKIQNKRLQEQAVIQEKKQKFNEDYNKAVVENIESKNIATEQERRRREEEALRNAEAAQKKIDDANAYKTLKAEAENFMSRFDEPPEFIEPDQFIYNPKDYKRQLPLEALGYGLLGLKGLNDANTELPLRDETVSQALLQYTADLKHLSEQGLRPEEEAKYKDQLAGAYAEGMNQLVRASNGNRNIVLGNMQGLQNARMRGITDMAIADINIKQQNFEKYGQAIKELNAFRMNKDIANHQIKLEDAKNKRQGGAALASSGFASMLEEIQYQKENGPGSANHRQNKAFEIFLTGVDSERPDDGRPFTPSGNAKAKAMAQAKWQEGMDRYNQNYNDYTSFFNLPQQEALKYSSFQDYINQLQKQRQPQQQPQQPQQQTSNTSHYDRFGIDGYQ